ncbi:gp436 family protein [Zavarzinia compransoris]|uniref:gp436 family protein n=1 Tax=Zavarzinia compransoris TaxID=1264899 RepID=UPI0010E4A520|nr:DUF1320 domain-containing protein [Zavarzinia compransoris]TDP46069.1 phage gp36-like protein [Zavarzinia compransoris]
MTYATADDLNTRFGAAEIVQLSDHAHAGAIDTGVVARALVDADDLINSYVASRYAVPLTPVPPIVVKWACDIARLYLYRDGVPEDVRRAYDNAVKMLGEVTSGAMTLAAGGVDAAASAAQGVKVMAPPRVFFRDALRAFVQGLR